MTQSAVAETNLADHHRNIIFIDHSTIPLQTRNLAAQGEVSSCTAVHKLRLASQS
jgi:hypothetical protein